MAELRIQLLGPTGAWRGDDPLDLGPAGQRAVLGLLLLASGQSLSRNEIVAGLWLDREPPPSAANVIQTYVKHLRRMLEPDRPRRAASTVLRKVGDGYALHLPPSTVDVQCFRDHVAAAVASQRCGQLERAAESLGEALGLWHGPPLADIPALAAHPKVVALAGERQAALARYGELMIATGRAADGLPALEEAAASQPLNEAWQARLISAYHAAGQRGQAFATFHGVRRRLAEDLGVDPGPELSAAHSALLHSDDRPAPAGSVTAQLPADTPSFAGRTAELSQLDGLPPSSLVVISGAPGVGKTALAVRWAHRVAPRFPDGQLYLNLRGFDPGGVVMEPGDAVRWALDSLGVPANRVPSTVDAQAALYRSRLAGRRMLVVLDNARDPAQVRPLLPGTPGCLVLVTARNQLASLVAAEGAHPLPLGPLDPGDARELLAQRVGAARTAGEPAAVAEILDRCAGLPLALVIIAARAALSGNLPLAALADRLRRGGDRLDALTTGDPGTDLRAVFSWSYRSLGAGAARLFRLLGLHPGPDVSVAAAASLAAVTVCEARRLLAELVRASLAAEPAAGRYRLHDLLRAYAAEVAVSGEPRRTRRAATFRMLDHYLHSAHAAARDPLTLPPPAPGVYAGSPGGPTGVVRRGMAGARRRRRACRPRLGAARVAARPLRGVLSRRAGTLGRPDPRPAHRHRRRPAACRPVRPGRRPPHARPRAHPAAPHRRRPPRTAARP
ncbi:MAG TPA: BTAD domain-containing putative transcriptional regulator [Candidatus Limnocylindrales bacterium]